MTSTLPYTLDRTVLIRATPETVFRFFTDDERWAAWWGPGSKIDPRPGGHVFIRYANGVEASGEVLEISPPDSIVFTFGFASGKPIPPGSSRVTIRLITHEEGTRVDLTHELADELARDQHVQGWRYQLSLFANVVADEAHARAVDVVDSWFSTWTVVDEAQREAVLREIAEHDIRFHDRFSAIQGLSEVNAHVGAAQRFMPGMRLERNGAVRHCQGTVLADWTAVGPDGQRRGAGTNVFTFNAAGRLGAVIGFWT
jgi:uncharacterized protein YndB with AHSA1/START domain